MAGLGTLRECGVINELNLIQEEHKPLDYCYL